MPDLVPLEPVDYLVIGHVTEDLSPAGFALGGTAVFASLTARAFGLRAGCITSMNEKTSLKTVAGIRVVSVPSAHTTTFQNVHGPDGRKHILHHRAESISLETVPEIWRRTSIVHLGPVAQELAAESAKFFAPGLLGMTPQGWMRTWDDAGRVTPCKWKSAHLLLPQAGAVVISREDVQSDDETIEAMAHQTRVLAVTEGASGSVLYWNGDRRRFRAPEVVEVESVGAGDIFAAAFFIRLFMTRDPWESARFATLLASRSVTRASHASIPTQAEIEECTVEVLK